VILCRTPTFRRVVSPLAAVGRTALTNYLMQTVLAVALFYSVGLGLYGQVGPAQGALWATAFFGLQTVGSVLWLQHFRFGVCEWLWRSLTYGRIQPLLERS
jgi:uncharacterized protein